LSILYYVVNGTADSIAVGGRRAFLAFGSLALAFALAAGFAAGDFGVARVDPLDRFVERDALDLAPWQVGVGLPVLTYGP